MPRANQVQLALLAACALSLTLAASAQQPKPAYDVVVVREWQAGQRPPSYRNDVYRQDPGRVLGQYSPLSALLRYAFHLNPSDPIQGLPAWGGPPGGDFSASAKFFVDARLPPSSTDAQSRLMMQSLLQDRFHLAWHWIKEPTKVLDLVVAPGGFKLRPPDPGKDTPPPTGKVFTCPPDVSGCAFLYSRAMTMAELAAALPKHFFGRPVVDHTGLGGTFVVPELVLIPPGEVSQSVPGAATELREATGLAFRPATETLPVLVVDHVTKP